VLLLAMLVVGDEELEYVVSDPPRIVGSMLVTGSGQTPEVIAADPGVMWIIPGSSFHSLWVRVTTSSCSEFVRARCPSSLDKPVRRPLCCM